MKKLMISIVTMFIANISFGQVTAPEPEYVGQVVVVNADGTTTLLQKETASIKTKSSKWGMIPVPGSGLLDNETDPRQVFGIMKLDVEKKARTFPMGDYSLMGGSNTTLSYNNVQFTAEKYGNSSYIVVIDNAEAGEYAVNTDFSQMSTFSVK